MGRGARSRRMYKQSVAATSTVATAIAEACKETTVRTAAANPLAHTAIHQPDPEAAEQQKIQDWQDYPAQGAVRFDVGKIERGGQRRDKQQQKFDGLFSGQ